MDWQSPISLGIVLATLAVFILRAIRRRPRGTCGHGCACSRPGTRPRNSP